jgi:hypothetical protein
VKNDYSGDYVSKGKGHVYTLNLKKDSTFVFKQQYEWATQCEGKWSIVKDSIFLKCQEEQSLVKIIIGSINQKDLRIKIINSNKLRVNNVVLKKQ